MANQAKSSLKTTTQFEKPLLSIYASTHSPTNTHPFNKTINTEPNPAIHTEIKGEINNLNDRAAMGLPEQYVDLTFNDLAKRLNFFRHLSAPQLVKFIQHTSTPLLDRYACSKLLALLGDPRIDPLNPTMITIPADTVSIGLDSSQVSTVVEQYQRVGVLSEWIQKETPNFKANIKTFRIAQLPVTNLEYREFLLDHPDEEIPDSWTFGRYPSDRANHPVYTLSEYSAERYCQWLSNKTGRQFRLPSEIEWEYSAAGPEGLEYPWGNDYRPNHANTAELGLFDSMPVGLFLEGASPFGVLDMAGNVEEYTANNYWAYPKGEFIADDLAQQQGDYRIARGGSFTRFADLCRCKRRHGRYNKSIYVMGFRLAESI